MIDSLKIISNHPYVFHYQDFTEEDLPPPPQKIEKKVRKKRVSKNRKKEKACDVTTGTSLTSSIAREQMEGVVNRYSHDSISVPNIHIAEHFELQTVLSPLFEW